ncbi:MULTISPECIES: glycosyltransferase family 1 protein [unclassified Actinopolyspora]|uniref:glycosyltransferase n=1 Tax=unclassified Actinopolyspora TaxID=2639451 RepID=UPI0013F612F1|nr:glycosyltransferase family 4 protein [Actinopolyspora sp. BKK2]NHE77146.1 glycosyltransferase family 4 protein [Actinopolyspora sp. BKK1]
MSGTGDDTRSPAGGREDGARDADTRIFVDARWTRTDFPDGISRYTAGLVEALHRIHPVTVLVHDPAQLGLLPAEVPHELINSPFSPRELWLSRTLHGLGAEVVFSPMQVIGGFRRRYAQVLTLHDLIYYRYPKPPEFLPLPVRVVWWLFHQAWWPQRVLLNRADLVVTVSETTRGLIERHRLTRRPVTVVPNAPTASSAAGAASSGGAERTGEQDGQGEQGGSPSALLYMGSFMPYKNVTTLISAMDGLPGYRLHLLSRIDPDRLRSLREVVPDGADVVFWNGVSEEDYRRLLRNAAALVTASRDEGFGLPLIEAMNAETPVVCSDIPIFREVTGGHAQFFDPDSVSGFIAAVRCFEDPETRAGTVESARAHAAGFTWEESARKLHDSIRRLVS